MLIQGITLTGTRIVDASLVRENLAIWIDANDSASYSGSGTTITDLSGNSRTQNLSNALAYTMLAGVKCWNCGIDGYFIRGAATTPQLPTTGFTYVAWARAITSSAGWRTLYRTTPDDHPLLVQIGTDNLGLYDNPTNSFYDSGYDVTNIEDTWVQYTVTGDSSGQTFYVNGQQVGTISGQTAAGNSHDYFGGIPTQPFGYVANMFLYTAKLTQEQIQQNYYNQLGKFTLSNIVTSNLVLWYDPGFATSYPGTGTTITNLASTSLTGTMSNISYTDPYFTYSGNSQIEILDNALLEPGSGSWTMEAWVYLSNATGSKVILGKFDPGGLSADVSYSIRISGSNIYAQMGDGTGSFINSTSHAMTLNTWTHVMYVWKNGATKTLETYVNGSSIGSVNHSLSSLLNTSANLYIGSYNNGEYSQYHNGRIGITRLYSAALTSAEVLQNYNADKNKYGL